MDAMEHVIEVTDETFDQVVIEGSKTAPVVVDLWADWCGPCRTLGPMLEKAATSATARSRSPRSTSTPKRSATRCSRRCSSQSIPTVVAFRDGQPVSMFIGAYPEDEVNRFLDSILPTEAELEAEGGRRRAGGRRRRRGRARVPRRAGEGAGQPRGGPRAREDPVGARRDRRGAAARHAAPARSGGRAPAREDRGRGVGDAAGRRPLGAAQRRGRARRLAAGARGHDRRAPGASATTPGRRWSPRSPRSATTTRSCPSSVAGSPRPCSRCRS